MEKKNAKCLLSIFFIQSWMIDFVIRIIELCDFTTCSINWCGGFAINCAGCNYSDYTTIHPNLKGANVQALSVLIS